MSVNDFLTLIVAAVAVAVPTVALIISDAVDKRATRSTLTDLAVNVNTKAVAYQDEDWELDANRDMKDDIRRKREGEHFVRMQEIEMLVGQADFLINRIKPGSFAQRIPGLARKPPYPTSVAVTLAQALETVNDPWWADRYWALSAQTDDEHVRALTYKYWGMALCARQEFQRGRCKVYEGLKVVTSAAASECIFRGDICAAMVDFDPERAGCWSAAALDEFDKVSSDDELYSVAEDRIRRVGPVSCDIAKILKGNPDRQLAKGTQPVSSLLCRGIGPCASQ